LPHAARADELGLLPFLDGRTLSEARKNEDGGHLSRISTMHGTRENKWE
jgi:hypothetical protein